MDFGGEEVLCRILSSRSGSLGASKEVIRKGEEVLETWLAEAVAQLDGVLTEMST